MPGEVIVQSKCQDILYFQKWIRPKMILPTKSSNHVEAQFHHWFNLTFRKTLPLVLYMVIIVKF